MISGLKKQIFPLFLIVVFFTAAGIGHGWMRSETRNLVGMQHPVSAEVAVSTALFGSVRGLITDVLFLRLIRLQEAGLYWEMNQLSGWIMNIQPRFGVTASFLAWNMAYNISMTTPNPEQRWRWVSAAENLLRDRAITANPADPSPWIEIVFLYLNKISGSYDMAQEYYKIAFANEMSAVFSATDSSQRLATMNLSLQKMSELDSFYAPFDWRLAESHAFYRAAEGLEFVADQRNIQLARLRVMALMASVRSGHLVWRNESSVIAAPVPAHIPALIREIERSYKIYQDDTFLMLLQTAYHDAIVLTYAVGDFQMAETYYHALQYLTSDHSYHDLSIKEFVMSQYRIPISDLMRERVQMFLVSLMMTAQRGDFSALETAKSLHREWNDASTDTAYYLVPFPPLSVYLKLFGNSDTILFYE